MPNTAEEEQWDAYDLADDDFYADAIPPIRSPLDIQHDLSSWIEQDRGQVQRQYMRVQQILDFFFYCKEQHGTIVRATISRAIPAVGHPVPYSISLSHGDEIKVSLPDDLSTSSSNDIRIEPPQCCYLNRAVRVPSPGWALEQLYIYMAGTLFYLHSSEVFAREVRLKYYLYRDQLPWMARYQGMVKQIELRFGIAIGIPEIDSHDDEDEVQADEGRRDEEPCQEEEHKHEDSAYENNSAGAQRVE